MTTTAASPFHVLAEKLSRALTVLCALGALCGLVAINAHATAGQPGTLDPFWANGSALGSGKLITAVGPRHDRPSAMAVQPDGKVLVAGFCLDIGLCATRHNTDGTLDASFGTAGKLPPVFVPNAANVSLSLALLPDGKLLLAGTCVDLGDNDFCLFRFNADGSVDNTFAASGSTITPIGSADDRARAMFTQPDGKIVVAGTCNNGIDSDFCTARYLPNGALDASFGNGGKIITAFSNRDDAVNAMLLQPDGTASINSASRATTAGRSQPLPARSISTATPKCSPPPTHSFTPASRSAFVATPWLRASLFRSTHNAKRGRKFAGTWCRCAR